MSWKITILLGIDQSFRKRKKKELQILRWIQIKSQKNHDHFFPVHPLPDMPYAEQAQEWV